MKVAIISDTHDNLASAKKAIEWLNKEEISLLLHCGDISSRETANELAKMFKGEIKFVRGNADVDLTDIPEAGEIQIEGKGIAFVHFPEPARRLAKTGKYDLVFYGHTHKPWEEMIGNCRMVNPGEAAGQFYKQTFAVYDTDKDEMELKIIELL